MSSVRPTHKAATQAAFISATTDSSTDHLAKSSAPRQRGRKLASFACAVGLAISAALGASAGASAQDNAGWEEPAWEEPAAEVAAVDAYGISNFALQFVGTPYVWGGNSPAGFDCSGFTQYVVLNTVGIDIGQGTHGQPGFGAWVDYGAWQPGDLVFFANTYGSGVSHTGIYIGNGEFVHAENYGTGVTISSIYSDYYSAHYYGATRLG